MAASFFVSKKEVSGEGAACCHLQVWVLALLQVFPQGCMTYFDHLLLLEVTEYVLLALPSVICTSPVG